MFLQSIDTNSNILYDSNVPYIWFWHNIHYINVSKMEKLFDFVFSPLNRKIKCWELIFGDSPKRKVGSI